MLCFFGTDDPLIQYDQAFQLTTGLDDADVPGRVELLLGTGHGWIGPDSRGPWTRRRAFSTGI